MPSMEGLIILGVLLGLLHIEQTYARYDPRIINGYSVDIQYFPFMASLQVDGRHLCGAAIVSSRTVVTAAHCDVYPAEFYHLRIGSTHFDRDGALVNVSSVLRHPQYNRRTADYDVAVITLAGKLDFQNSGGRIAPIPLPEEGYTPQTGLGVVVLGWGTTNPADDSTPSSQLQSAALRVVNTSDCAPQFPPAAITERMFCAQNHNLRQDACTGDSGGPMYGFGQLIGIISWGFACADGHTPGVYTSVPQVLDFITSNLI